MLQPPPLTPVTPTSHSPDRPIIARRPLPPGAALQYGAGADAVTVADTHQHQHHQHHPNSLPYRNVAVSVPAAASSTTSPVDSAYSPTRSTSFASQQFTALPVPKQRSGSVVAPASPPERTSPRKHHRLSRSISETISPATFDHGGQSPEQPAHRARSLHKRPSDSFTSPRKSSIRMISAASFGGGVTRRTSEAVSQHSHGSSMNTPSLPSVPQASVATAPSGGHSPVALYNHIHDTTNKRMATLEYLRKV